MEPKATPLLEVKNASKSFRRIIALKDVSFRVYQKEIVGLVGDNGAGKSTLIKIISGVFPPDEGELYFEGKKVQFSSPKKARALGIESVYQDLALFEDVNVWRNIFLGKELGKSIGPIKLLDGGKMAEESYAIVKKIGLTLPSIEDPIRTLSGGERQSLAIGRCLHFGAKLLLLDEPTSALSIKEGEKVLESIKKARDLGLSIIFITHNLYHVYPVADRFVVLTHGVKTGDVKKEGIVIEKLAEMIRGHT
jgi:simple sugar transport system ATP-binding protein